MILSDVHSRIGKNTMLGEIDAKILDTYSKKCKNTTFIEIGSYVGTSTIILAQNCQKLYCIDPFSKEYKNIFIENLKLFNINNVIMFETKIQNCPDISFINEIGFAFIDTDHTYETTMCSFIKIKDLVESKGFVCFHDYKHPKYPDVERVVSDILRQHKDWIFIEHQQGTCVVQKH
jgi:predicted O-methyltransferase YrrM